MRTHYKCTIKKKAPCQYGNWQRALIEQAQTSRNGISAADARRRGTEAYFKYVEVPSTAQQSRCGA